jgi:signal transduction histidine kinase
LLLPLAGLALLLGSYVEAIWAPRFLAEAEASYLRTVDRQLDTVAEGLVPLLLGHNLDIVYENLTALAKRNPQWVQVRLLLPSGRQIYPLASGDAQEPGGADIRRLEKPVDHLDKSLATLVVSLDLAPTIARLGRQTRELALLLFAMLGIMWVTLALVIEFAVRKPVFILAEAANRLSAAEYDAPLPRTGADEVGMLVQAFASMRDELRRQRAELQEEHQRVVDEARERQRAEAEVRLLNSLLEQRVAQRTAELEAANRELESFSYSVSHDLRAPLRAIDGFSHLLEADYRELLDEDGRHYLETVRANAGKMAQLIDDILAFSRMGRQEIARQVVDVAELTREVFAELQAPIAGHRLRLDVQALPPARGDRAMLRQVLVNLLANAIKFSSTRDEGVIEVGCSEGPQENEYFVRDNGVGFDMQYADKLFGVFQRLHTAYEFPGTGIGLAIVKRIVTRHGGRVWAEGKVDGGATFRFTLPAANPRESSAESP